MSLRINRRGLIVEAKRSDATGEHTIQYQRDVMGRIVLESQGDQTIRYSVDAFGRRLEEVLLDVPGVAGFGRKTGSGAGDEPAEGVNMSEAIVSFDPASGRSRVETIPDTRATIIDTLWRLAARHRVIVCSGGLGPTTDDLTPAGIDELTGKIAEH